MTRLTPWYAVLLLFLTAVSCADRPSEPAEEAHSISLALDLDSAIVERARKKLIPKTVALYTISESIYSQTDTVWRFRDGLQAYKFQFGGGAFLDSTATPIHKRYKKTLLTQAQVETLSAQFRSHFYDGIGHACTPMYRDVLVFSDSSGKPLAQVQICFGCHETAVYPTAYFDYRKESALNWDQFKNFIDHVKK